eukprot:CAMPEP_0203756794 /NCGR_PEP_ID=MMETSP0098-20131031/9999_1 /ASSEMBLY_ACC=CAM_ASM_000208 /TAXON_ID=96639 /ORGANISM=" , Strain NY0313808BC1" /LENGTH=421 /DNA_ID=CAMNT_0050648793 /DNA_START=205 /DNA_END=1470 /DNA_ORIENTATION=+
MGKMMVLWLVALVVLVVQDRAYGTPKCSSLDGPYCSLINGRKVPKHATQGRKDIGGSKTGEPKKVLQDLVDALSTAAEAHGGSSIKDRTANIQASLRDFLEKYSAENDLVDNAVEESPLQGKFQIYGVFNPWIAFSETELDFELMAGDWLKKPGPDWVTVGLKGKIRKLGDVYRLEGAIIDVDTNKPLEGCTRLVAQRKVKRGEGFNQWSEVLEQGKWVGTYRCGPWPTDVTLYIRRTEIVGKKQARLPAGEVTGEFEFVANRDKQQVVFDEQTIQALLSRGVKGSNMKVVKVAKKVTESGCACLDSWEFQNDEGERFEFKGGVCGNPGNIQEKDFCIVDLATCTRLPVGENWDYCVANWKHILGTGDSAGVSVLENVDTILEKEIANLESALNDMPFIEDEIDEEIDEIDEEIDEKDEDL